MQNAKPKPQSPVRAKCNACGLQRREIWVYSVICHVCFDVFYLLVFAVRYESYLCHMLQNRERSTFYRIHDLRQPNVTRVVITYCILIFNFYTMYQALWLFAWTLCVMLFQIQSQLRVCSKIPCTFSAFMAVILIFQKIYLLHWLFLPNELIGFADISQLY